MNIQVDVNLEKLTKEGAKKLSSMIEEGVLSTNSLAVVTLQTMALQPEPAEERLHCSRPRGCVCDLCCAEAVYWANRDIYSS